MNQYFFLFFLFINFLFASHENEQEVFFIQEQNDDGRGLFLNKSQKNYCDIFSTFINIHRYQGSMGFYAELIGDDENGFNTKKQSSFYQKINDDVCYEKYELLKKTSFVATCESREKVTTAFIRRLPYYGYGVENDGYSKDTVFEWKKFQKMVFGCRVEKTLKGVDSTIKGHEEKMHLMPFEEPIVAFPAGLSMVYKYHKEEVVFEDRVYGFIAANGVNFEFLETSDYKKFIDGLTGIIKHDELKIHIKLIMKTLVYAAAKLVAQYKENQEIKEEIMEAHLYLVGMGMGCFFNFLIDEDKEIVADLYMNSLFDEIEKYNNCVRHDGLSKIKWKLNFFHRKTVTRDYYKESVNKLKKKEKEQSIEILFRENTSLFDPSFYCNHKAKNSLKILVMPGDANALIGNAGANDNSVEALFVGKHNDNCLSQFHLINCLMGDILGVYDSNFNTLGKCIIGISSVTICFVLYNYRFYMLSLLKEVYSFIKKQSFLKEN